MAGPSSASSEGQTGLQTSGGNINNAASSNVPWIVVAILGTVGLGALALWLATRKGGK